MKTEDLGKTNSDNGKRRRVADLRYMLTASFIVFAVVLMGILWIFQSVFLDRYYEFAMSRRCAKAVTAVANYYSTSEDGLSYEKFMQYLGETSQDNDIFFWIESTDGSFHISSTDAQIGRGMRFNTRQLIDEAREKLVAGGGPVHFTSKDPIGNSKDYVYARYVESSDRNPVYIYALAVLTPLGPAVGILRSQLLVVTVIALVIGIFVARITSKHLAKPIIKMEVKARELAKGNYDVSFEGGSYREMEDLADTLNQTAKDLKATDALQKDLIANVSHDLRTPLTMIKSYAELIRDISGDNPAKREEHLEVIIKETDRLDELVGDILTLSRMQAGVMEMKMEDFDLQEAAESVFSTYKVMEQEGFKFRLTKVPGSTVVHADRHRIQQVIANLLSNAIRYSKDTKEVSLEFSRDSKGITCSVSDKGIGIAEEDLEKIWNRYQKASKQGKRSSQGTGLGLSIASEVLKQHGADYGVESKPGEGSRFWFTLPQAKDIEK